MGVAPAILIPAMITVSAIVMTTVVVPAIMMGLVMVAAIVIAAIVVAAISGKGVCGECRNHQGKDRRHGSDHFQFRHVWSPIRVAEPHSNRFESKFTKSRLNER